MAPSPKLRIFDYDRHISRLCHALTIKRKSMWCFHVHFSQFYVEHSNNSVDSIN